MKGQEVIKGLFFLLAFIFLLGFISAGIVNGYHFDEKDNTQSEQEFLFVKDFADGYHGLKGSYAYHQYPESVAGKAGYGYRFDGVDDRIGFGSYGSAPYFAYPFSLEVWIKPESVSGARTIMAGKNFVLGINNIGCLYFVDPHVGTLTTNKCSWNLNEWYNIGFVYDGNNYRLYVNNQEVGKNPYQTSLSGDFDFRQMEIGVKCVPGAYNPCNNFFKGVIDEIKFYDYAKTSFDVGINVAYRTESCEQFSCASGLTCREDFYSGKFDRCCDSGECLYDENCYSQETVVNNGKYVCVNGGWRIKNKKTTGSKVLDLPLNEGSGNRANDVSSYDNDGILVGDPAPSWIGGGIDFSEAEWTPSERRKHISVKNNESLNFDYAVTVEADVNYYNLNHAWCTTGGIVSKGLMEASASTGPVGYHLSLGSVYSTTDKRFCFRISTDTSRDQKVCSNTEYVAGQWYKLKGAYDGEYLGIYVNGVLESKVPAKGKILNSDSWLGDYELIIGAQAYTIAVPWRLYTCGMNGIVDNVKIYDYAENLGSDIYWYNKCISEKCVAELCPVPGEAGSCPSSTCTTNSDCIYIPPNCGNNKVESGEECDDGNNITCDGCSFCKIDKCGDGRICGSEQCDGINLNGKNCTSLGFVSGSLSCGDCAFNTSGCSAEQIVPCTLKRAYWTDSGLVEYLNSSKVKNNTLVFLKQELNGNCKGKQVSFLIKYQNSTNYPGYFGLVDADNNTNTAVASWRTDNSGVNGTKFFFRSELIGSSQSNLSGIIVVINTTSQEPDEECRDYSNFTCCNSSLCNTEILLSGCGSGKKCCLSCSQPLVANQPFVGCGDGVIQAGEQCDGSSLGGKTCFDIDDRYIGGNLRCYSNCTFNSNGCFIEGGFNLNDNSQKKSSEKESSLTTLFIIILVILFLIILLLLFYYFWKVKGFREKIKGSGKSNFIRQVPPGPSRMPPMISSRPGLGQQRLRTSPRPLGNVPGLRPNIMGK